MLAEKLAAEIDALATLAAKVRNQAADTLERSVSDEYTDAREIGGIVSMWSLLENVASVILEEGYLTKGKDEQNPTMFYFRK